MSNTLKIIRTVCKVVGAAGVIYFTSKIAYDKGKIDAYNDANKQLRNLTNEAKKYFHYKKFKREKDDFAGEAKRIVEELNLEDES